MRATELVFRHRFWFFFLAYLLGFGTYAFDHMSTTEALVRWMFRRSDPHLDSLAARHAFQGLFTLSAVLVSAAAGIRTWGGAYLRTEVVQDMELHTERLVAEGPYRHLRNPLYFGTMLLAVGMAMVAPRIGGAVLVLGNLFIVLCLIGHEEAELAQSQGEAYRAFMTVVPRLWPSLRPRLPSGGMQPRWLQAFLGEGWMWIFGLDGFLLAWTLDGRLYSTLLWSCGGTYIVVWRLLRRRRKSPPSAPDAPSRSSA